MRNSSMYAFIVFRVEPEQVRQPYGNERMAILMKKIFSGERDTSFDDFQDEFFKILSDINPDL